MTVLISKNIILRPYNAKDVQDLYENFNDIKVTQFMTGVRYPYTLKDAKKWISSCNKAPKQKPRKEITWVIEKDKIFVGSISLKNIEKHKAELGYWLGRKFWNKGITTESVKIVTDFGFKKLKLKRLYAYVFSKNILSSNVLEKNGFKKEGFLRKDRVKDGKLIDVYLYSKVK